MSNGKFSRNKGARGERELKNMLKESFPEFQEGLKRNQGQSESGGHDLLGLPGYAPEVKNVETFQINPMWSQTIEQARHAKATPVLFRKISLKGWWVYMSLKDINPSEFSHIDDADPTMVVMMSYQSFVCIARQRYDLLNLGN